MRWHTVAVACATCWPAVTTSSGRRLPCSVAATNAAAAMHPGRILGWNLLSFMCVSFESFVSLLLAPSDADRLSMKAWRCCRAAMAAQFIESLYRADIATTGLLFRVFQRDRVTRPFDRGRMRQWERALSSQVDAYRTLVASVRLLGRARRGQARDWFWRRRLR